MCSMGVYETAKIASYDYISSGYGRPIEDTSNTDALEYLFVSVDSFDQWIKSLAFNYVWRFQAYYDNMNKLFKKFPTTMPVKISQNFKEKRKLLLR